MKAPTNSALFDTNAFIAWLDEDRGFAEVVRGVTDYFIAFASVAELEFGVLNGKLTKRDARALRRGLRYFHVIFPDDQTLDCYASICVDLRRKGRPIPKTDLWIAAVALQHQLPLLTNDRHFDPIDGLGRRGW